MTLWVVPGPLPAISWRYVSAQLAVRWSEPPHSVQNCAHARCTTDHCHCLDGGCSIIVMGQLRPAAGKSDCSRANNCLCVAVPSAPATDHKPACPVSPGMAVGTGADGAVLAAPLFSTNG